MVDPDVVLDCVRVELEAGRPEHAKMVLLEALDRALRRSDYDFVVQIMVRYPLDSGPPGAITGMMMVIRPARVMLGDVLWGQIFGGAWDDYVRRASVALVVHHGWSADRVEASVRRLAP